MSRPHRALVVVSEPALLDPISTVLTSQGLTWTAAPCQEDAERALRARGFCLVVLDLRTSTQAGQPARVETGINVLARLRAERPSQALPVVVLLAKGASASLRERVQQVGGTSVVPKPLKSHLDLLEQRIRTAAGCCQARRGRCPDGPGLQPGDLLTYRSQHTLHFVGTCRTRRHLLLVDQHEVYLPRWQFEGLLKLAASLTLDPTRFVPRDPDLGPSANKLLSKLCQELEAQASVERAFLDRDNWGGVRLSLPPGLVTYDLAALEHEFSHLLQLLDSDESQP